MSHTRHSGWAIAEISDGRCCAMPLGPDPQAAANTIALWGSGAVRNAKIVLGGGTLFEFSGGTWVRIHLVEMLREL